MNKPDRIKVLPAYSLVDASRLLGLSESTLRRWFRGYKYTSNSVKKTVRPILPTLSESGEQISFIDLVEAHVFSLLRRQFRIPRQKIKAAAETLSEIKGSLISLAHRDFYVETQNKQLLIQLEEGLMSLSERGQFVDKGIVSSGLEQLQYGDDGYASEFFPRIGNVEQREIVVSPSINFGRICIHRSGVSAEIIAARFKAGDSFADLIEDFKATTDEIEGAIRWHGRLAA